MFAVSDEAAVFADQGEPTADQSDSAASAFAGMAHDARRAPCKLNQPFRSPSGRVLPSRR